MGTEPGREPASPTSPLRRIPLRFPGVCVLCGTALAKGTEALHDPAARTVRCLACPVPGSGPTDHPIDLTRYQVANCYMGRAGLINSGGASGENDFAEAVKVASGEA